MVLRSLTSRREKAQMTLTFQPLELSLYTHEACQVSLQLKLLKEMHETPASSVGRSVRVGHDQVVKFEASPFKFDLEVSFDKYIPVKINATLRVMKIKTEKVSEYQIEITKFIGENMTAAELEISAQSGKPAPMIVRAFKFKCCLQN